MVKITNFMLWEAFGYDGTHFAYSPRLANRFIEAAEKLNKMLSSSSPKDEQTDDLQGIPQECP